jgi:phage terminase large subunit-like protein
MTGYKKEKIERELKLERCNPFDPRIYPYTHKGHRYAWDIIDGKIPSSLYLRGACIRYVNDVFDKDNPVFYFDPEKSEKYLRLVQKFEHVIGNWETANIKYEPWQCWVWACIMGFMNRSTGFRRFRLAHIEVSRGNGKSLMASQTSLYMLALDDPKGNMIATVATKKEQARIVLDAARGMARKNKGFIKAKGVKVLAHTITQERTDSMMRALSSEHSGLDGLNDVLAVCDELHAMKRETFEVIYSGMSKRKDSLTLCITTAGLNMNNVGYSQTCYARQVSLGKIEDDQFFSALYCIDDEDDIFDKGCWIKSNPNWGVSVDPVTFEAKANKAKITPADIPGFTVKHLNRWLSEAHAFFTVNKWDECIDPRLKMNDFKGELCRIGLDLASHVDIASIVAVVKKNDMYYLFERSFIPEAALRDLNNALYDGFVHSGELITTPGEVINYDIIKEHLIEFSNHFNVIECMYDPWNATEMAQNLADYMEMIKFPMNTSNISEPMKKLDSIIREKEIRHNGSNLYRWCLGNVVAKEDHNGNVFPRKTNVKFKIDPVVATILGLAGWVKEDLETPAYEHHGVRFIKL